MCWTFYSKEARHHNSKKSIIVKLVLLALLTRWAIVTVDVIQADQSLNSEWNPYKLLHI
jgi:hypothetical protein